jgi:DNA invertase Pin-like site-specific DNA recombinase
VFAEFERAMIQEPVRAGLARARSEGTTLGRPKISATVEKAIRATLASGMLKTAKLHGVGCGTVQRISRWAPVGRQPSALAFGPQRSAASCLAWLT